LFRLKKQAKKTDYKLNEQGHTLAIYVYNYCNIGNIQIKILATYATSG
jgi:hypothetical protein